MSSQHDEHRESSLDSTLSSSVSRRGFLKGAGVAAAAVSLAGPGAVAATKETIAPSAPVFGVEPIKMKLNINGQEREVMVEPWMTLLDVLRDRLDLTGSKRVCNRGSCGGCTVIADGKTINSCSMLVIDAVGKRLTTIEGLANGDKLAPIQEAFVACDALQCGFCTPGMVMSCHALLTSSAKPSRTETAEAIAGNICRCGTYANIFEAVDMASGQGGKSK